MPVKHKFLPFSKDCVLLLLGRIRICAGNTPLLDNVEIQGYTFINNDKTLNQTGSVSVKR